MFESMVSFLMIEHQGGAVFDPARGPTGYVRMSSRHRHPYRTSDGLIGVMIYTDSQWARFFELIGCPELAHDPRFATMTQRTEHTDELYSIVDDTFEGASTDEWISMLRKSRIPAMRVSSIEEVLDDEHLQSTGFVERREDPELGSTRSVKFPIVFSRSEPAAPGRPPALGEHNLIRGPGNSRTGR